MILVLLYRFSESQESLLGYELCKRLVQEGHDLLVTTTSTAKWLENEIQRAKELTETSPGSITIIEPEYRELEEPSIDWIANLSKQYFGRLYSLTKVSTIIGTLPGTSQTAVELKDSLKCKLILLATTKTQSENNSLENESISLAERADEIWSVGPDTYQHYQKIFYHEFTGKSHHNHKEILLQPPIRNFPNLDGDIKEQQPRYKIVSIWNKPIPFFHKGKKMYSKGTDLKSFSSFGAALGHINANSVQQQKLTWNVYGLRFADSVIGSIKTGAKPNKLQLNALGKVPPVDSLNWSANVAFVLPDVCDESFNFIALCSICLGIPTLVSSQSSIGKLLSNLSCPAANRSIVSLTGILSEDMGTWVNKIESDILSKDAKQWAKELSEYVRSNGDLWKLDSSVLGQQPSDRNTDADAVDISHIIDKVTEWQISMDEEDDTSYVSKSQVSTYLLHYKYYRKFNYPV